MHLPCWALSWVPFSQTVVGQPLLILHKSAGSTSHKSLGCMSLPDTPLPTGCTTTMPIAVLPTRRGHLRGRLSLPRLCVPRAQPSTWHSAWHSVCPTYRMNKHVAVPPAGSSSLCPAPTCDTDNGGSRPGGPLTAPCDPRGRVHDLLRYQLPGRLGAQTQGHVSQPF